MKIGVVCPYDISRSGGVQQHVLAQAAELRKRGHSVRVITPRPRGYKGETPRNTIFMGNSTKVRAVKSVMELGMNFTPDAVDDMLAAEKFDLLHVHEPEVPMLGAQIIAKAECPVIGTFHAVFPDTPMGKTIESLRVPFARSIFSRLSVMTAASEIPAGFIRERTGQDVTVVPNGVDLEAFHPSASVGHKKKKQILFIGRLEKRKGVRYLLSAYAELRATRQDVELLIGGDGPERARLEAMIDDYEIPDVKFLGFVSDKEKIRLLQTADLFCSPALYGESFGIVLLEAMACNVVIVAGDNAGYASVMKERGQWSLVNPKDIPEFARRLEIMLHDEDMRALWQQWAQEYVKEFSYPKIVDKYEELYAHVLKKSKSRANG